MASQDVNITAIDGTKAAHWSTETTLLRVASSSDKAATLLKGLGEKFQVDGKYLGAIASNTGAVPSTINNLTNATKEGNAELIKNMNKVRDGINSALRFDGERLSAPFEAAGSGLTKFAKNIVDKSPQWSKWLGVAGIGITIFGELFEQIGKQTEEMQKLYSNGILVQNGFSGLSDAAIGAGLSTSELAKNLNKFSNVVVGMGVKNTTNLMKMFSETTRRGAEFGMTNSAAQEALLETMDTMQNFGILTNMSEQDKIKYTKEYLNNLNDLSEMTGRNRDEIRKQVQAYSKTTTAFLAMQMLPKEVQKNFQNIQASVFASFGPAGNRVMDEVGKYMAGGVGMMSKEFQLLMTGLGQGAGDTIAEMAEATRRGDEKSAMAAKQKLITIMGNMSPEQARMMQIYAKTNPAFAQLYTELTQASQAERQRNDEIEKEVRDRRARGETEDKIRAERTRAADKEKESLKAHTDAIESSKVATRQLQTMFHQMVADLGPVLVPMLKAFGDTLKYVLDIVRSFGSTIKSMVTWAGGSQETGNVAAVVGVAVTTIIGGALLMKIVKSLTGSIVGAAGGMLGKLGGAGVGALSKVPGLGFLGGATTGAAGGAAATATSGLGKAVSGLGKGVSSIAKRLPGIGAILGLGLGAMEITDTNKREKAGEIDADEASRLRGSAVGGGAGAALGAVLGTLVGGPIGTIIGGIIGEQIGSKVGEYWPEIKSGLQTASDFIGDFVSDVGDKVANGLSWMSEKVSNSFTKTKDFITSSWDSVSDFIGNFVTTTGEKVAKGLSWIGDTISNTFEKAQEVISTTWKNVSNFVGNASSVAVNGVKSAYKWATDIFENKPVVPSITPNVNPKTPQTTTPPDSPVTPLITTDQLNAKTLEYYDNSINKMAKMIEKLETLHDGIDRLRTSNDDGFGRLIDAYGRTTQVV